MQRIPKGFRTLTIDNAVYRVRVGRSFVRIIFPDGEQKAFGVDVVTGRDQDIIDRGRWKKTSDGMVRPKHIAAFIKGLPA